MLRKTVEAAKFVLIVTVYSLFFKKTEILDLDTPEKLCCVYFDANKYHFEVVLISDTFSA